MSQWECSGPYGRMGWPWWVSRWDFPGRLDRLPAPGSSCWPWSSPQDSPFPESGIRRRAAARRGAAAHRPFLGAGALEGGCVLFHQLAGQGAVARPTSRSPPVCPRKSIRTAGPSRSPSEHRRRFCLHRPLSPVQRRPFSGSSAARRRRWRSPFSSAQFWCPQTPSARRRRKQVVLMGARIDDHAGQLVRLPEHTQPDVGAAEVVGMQSLPSTDL
jgi:hypothetical protein